MRFGEKLREQRNKAGLTQGELAKMLEVTRNTLANYERGISHPQDRKIYYKLADFFEVDVNYFLTENEEFLTEVAEKYGRRGLSQAESILEQAAALFAGGGLSETDKEVFLRDMQALFLDSKEQAREKYTPKKHRNKKTKQILPPN
jgi:transcriptional regulator with XRE-family HTH domain